jgi:hypothetical protein
MPRTCTICTHKQRTAIDKALVARQAFRHIAKRYSVSTAALVRHSDDHLPSSLLKAQAAREAANADALLAQVVDLRGKALSVLEKAEGSDDLRAAVSAIREARGCVELLAKLAGELKDAPTINLVLSAEWLTIQGAVLRALEPHPAARLDVASELERVGCVEGRAHRGGCLDHGGQRGAAEHRATRHG